jgi:hypothetical protein
LRALRSKMSPVSPEGEGPLFQDNRANTWGKPALIIVLGVIAVTAIVLVSLILVGVIF